VSVACPGRLPVRVDVDSDACEANGICAGLVPEVFEVDDDDTLHILISDVPERLADKVRLAVGSCPKAALRLAPSAASAAGTLPG
jgi:ferredoxin